MPNGLNPATRARTASVQGYPGHIAVVIPCRNEAAAIDRVVTDFRAALPWADIHVCDNASTDATLEVAAAAGAIIHRETEPGKGNVVRRMFSDIEADIYVLVDGDDTYDARSAPKMVDMLENEQLDMVVGTRIAQSGAAYRLGHRFGNFMFTTIIAKIFGNRVSDVLSGYRVFSRRFVKSFPALSTGFETETEFTVHALELRMPIGELATPYKERPAESASKLNAVRDGIKISWTIIRLFKEERPLGFFGIAGTVFALLSLILAWPVVITWLNTGLVPRLPTAVLATGLMLLAFLSWTCGAILGSVSHSRRELRRLWYLSIPRNLRPLRSRQSVEEDPELEAIVSRARQAGRP
jgi:glycosyltransferase involved in cell wall biosynthesis